MSILNPLLFDRSADFVQVLAKCVIGIDGLLFQILGKLQLLAQRLAGFDQLGLFAFLLPNVAGGFNELFCRLGQDKNTAVVIGKDNIILRYFEFAELGDAKRVVRPRIEALRPGWRWTVTENREADLLQFRSVAVCSPDHNSREFVRLCFQCGEIADATFIGSTGVIDYENVVRLGGFHCFQENVNAPEMFCGERVASETGP